ncbi:MAG: hypothetical protein IH860_09215, partial [Chloroflexi bacterium]|nr:hypothetical protein [Chloroflexota bacterium]
METIPLDVISKFEAYKISRLVIDGERVISIEDEEGAEELDEADENDIQDQNLHAKLFVFESETEAVWILGSANATKAA